MSLADTLERAAAELSGVPGAADALRDANGDPQRVLDALGVAGAAEVLAWALAREPEAGEELLEAWAGREEAAALLERVDERVDERGGEADLPKRSRKALRRARHQLRSRGVAVGAPAPAPRVARVGRGEEPVEGCFVSPLDPAGARVITWIEDNPGGGVGGGARLFQVVTDARHGVTECEVYTTTRGRARRFAREITGRERFPATPVPREAARALLARAAARQAADRPLPRAFVELRSHLVGDGGDAATPGERVRRELGAPGPEERTTAAVRRVVELLRGGEILPWLPPTERLRTVAGRLQEAAEGRIVVSGAARREQLDAIVGEGAAEVFAGEEAERAAEWLEETAYLLWRADREEDARACLGAARHLREVDSEAGESELRRALLEVALAPILERLRRAQEEAPDEEGSEEAGGDEQGSLLVKP